MARSKEDNQGFQIRFWTAELGEGFRVKTSADVWLRHTGSGLCAKTLHASGLWLHFSMFQNMVGSFWANLDTSGIKGPGKKTGKTENLRSVTKNNIFLKEYFQQCILYIKKFQLQKLTGRPQMYPHHQSEFLYRDGARGVTAIATIQQELAIAIVSDKLRR